MMFKKMVELCKSMNIIKVSTQNLSKETETFIAGLNKPVFQLLLSV